MVTRYTASDGKLVLSLEVAEEGGYIVTSPLDPELVTEAETIEEAFANAHDASRRPQAGASNCCAGFPPQSPLDLTARFHGQSRQPLRSGLRGVPPQPRGAVRGRR